MVLPCLLSPARPRCIRAPTAPFVELCERQVAGELLEKRLVKLGLSIQTGVQLLEAEAASPVVP